MRSKSLMTLAVVVTLSEAAVMRTHSPFENFVEVIVEEESTLVQSTAESWPCEVRSWVRAPDLAPSGTFPAQARLALNGSACGDVVGWQVGLRYKERAIIKKKSTTVEFPVKPEWNSSQQYQSVDWNDIYVVNGGMRYMDNHGEEMNRYNEALQNPKLWDIHGVERNVFDITQDLPLESNGDMTFVDAVVPFFVHVPDINLPPMEENCFRCLGAGSDGEILNAETLFEYYHLVTLANGTVLDVPAGRSGFLPSSRKLPIEDRAYGAWPSEMSFTSPRNATSKASDNPRDWMEFGRNAPACDADGFAKFKMQIISGYTPAIQGQNMTINLLISRTGNGTEYPAYLDVKQTNERNITWAHNYIESEEAYDKITGVVSSPRRRRWMQGGREAGRMLVVKPQSVLEKDRDGKINAARGSVFTFDDGVMPWNGGDFRYDFGFDQGSDESYEVAVEVPIHYNALPPYETTFEAIKANLVFTLHTKFRCQLDEFEKETRQALESHVASEDEEWTEYQLPQQASSKRNMILEHYLEVPIDILLSSDNSGGDVEVKSYLDPESLAPILSTTSTRPAHYPKIGSELRKEGVDELRKSRFGASDNERRRKGRGSGRHTQWEANGGGGWAHAAKLWQSYVEKRRLQEDKTGSFVIQA
ncbi:hypothetical protein BCR39DRAFT_588501 [Naematelia encephala]|uniref:Uncharacterized protein n=1 Tax=Naematelia encephala TaxID=71784 RepID=A0A1Y2B3C1_9TREE|nr:hypothetical protein BCR39DRAFT_588501 [Naematelia encephala]